MKCDSEVDSGVVFFTHTENKQTGAARRVSTYKCILIGPSYKAKIKSI